MNLDGKIKKTQALSGRLVKSSGGGGSIQEIYWVQYGIGTATNAEVNEAVAANKLPICYFDSTNAYGQAIRTLYFLVRHTPTEAFFATVLPTTQIIEVKRLYADAWTTQTIRYEGRLTWDTRPRFGSANPVTSGGIYNAIQNATVSDERIAEAVDDWLSVQAPSIGTLSYAAKQALLACFRHVAWIDDQGQSYYNALESELFPDATLESITAVFTQGSAVIYDTDSLDTLRQYLVVTATFSDSTTATVTDYTLSGTLTVGTSTITVSYGGKTDSFSVTVLSWDYAWDYSMGYLTANGFTMQTGTTGSAVLQDNGLLLTANRQFNKDTNPVCTTCVFETTFTLVAFDSVTTPNRGYRLIIFNGTRAVTLNVKESGLEAYNYTTSSYDIAAPVVLNKEYVLRVEVGQTTGKLYLDGELVLTVPLGATAAMRSIVAQIGSDNGRKTLVKNVRYSYQS